MSKIQILPDRKVLIEVSTGKLEIPADEIKEVRQQLRKIEVDLKRRVAADVVERDKPPR